MLYSKRLSPKSVAKQLPLLKIIFNIKELHNRRALLQAGGPELIDSASSIARNVLNGNLKIKNPRLKKLIFGKRKKDMEKLACLKTPRSKKLTLLLKGGQKGGLIGAIIGGLASLIAPLISKLF